MTSWIECSRPLTVPRIPPSAIPHARGAGHRHPPGRASAASPEQAGTCTPPGHLVRRRTCRAGPFSPTRFDFADRPTPRRRVDDGQWCIGRRPGRPCGSGGVFCDGFSPVPHCFAPPQSSFVGVTRLSGRVASARTIFGVAGGAAPPLGRLFRGADTLLSTIATRFPRSAAHHCGAPPTSALVAARVLTAQRDSPSSASSMPPRRTASARRSGRRGPWLPIPGPGAGRGPRRPGRIRRARGGRGGCRGCRVRRPRR